MSGHPQPQKGPAFPGYILRDFNNGARLQADPPYYFLGSWEITQEQFNELRRREKERTALLHGEAK